MQNLYFAYLFVLRAVMKAAPVLTSYQYDTGLEQEDQKTQQLITGLVRVPWRLLLTQRPLHVVCMDCSGIQPAAYISTVSNNRPAVQTKAVPRSLYCAFWPVA